MLQTEWGASSIAIMLILNRMLEARDTNGRSQITSTYINLQFIDKNSRILRFQLLKIVRYQKHGPHSLQSTATNNLVIFFFLIPR